MKKKFRNFALTGAATAAALLLAACSGATEPAPATDASPELQVALITHSAPGDTFWDIVRKGAEAAAEKDNIELLYNSDPDGAKQAQLVEQAVDQGVDGIVVTLAKPEALAGAVAQAVAAGIPVFSMNGGEDVYEQLGVLAHFGQNEEVAGEAAGAQLTADGASHALCVIHEQGNVGHEARCDGAALAFNGTMERLYVNGADMPNVASTITAKLQAEASIDAVLTLGAPFAMTAITAVADAGSTAQIATFDLSADAIGELESGNFSFVVDQQPYLQGYSAVDAVWLYVTNGNVLGGGNAVLTGPQIITAETASTLAEFAAGGTR